MKYGYTIIYVSSVMETLEFYKKAFGFNVRFLHESNSYGELETGDTVLAFASHEIGNMNFDEEYTKSNVEEMPLGFELGFVTEDVFSAFERAVSAGALILKEPKEKPWGQVVGYVRAIDGTVVEICSPMEG